MFFFLDEELQGDLPDQALKACVAVMLGPLDPALDAGQDAALVTEAGQDLHPPLGTAPPAFAATKGGGAETAIVEGYPQAIGRVLGLADV